MKKFNKNLTDIINILNDNKYHDIKTIAKRLNLTDTTVCNIINKLKEYGVKFKNTKDKEYQLQESILLINKEEIQKNLSDNLKKIINIEIFENIGSTNNYLKTKYTKKSYPTICITELQTQGKGRFNRTWHSPFGKNILLSCQYWLEKDISKLSGISIVAGLSVLKTLNNYINNQLFIKWPNDIICQGKKLVGILIEANEEINCCCSVIIGIGINVNMSKCNQIINEWTSIKKITNINTDRNKLSADLIINLIDYLKTFEKNGFATFIDEWKSHDIMLNKLITIKEGNNKIEGLVKGINEQGHLLLKLKNGKIKAFSSGDTTIIKSV